jgi:hypothetical protein
MTCCGNDNEALGLPPGSVRALLGLFIIPPVVGASIALMLLMFSQGQYTSALGILSGLTGMAGLVVGFYFGNKSADKATSEIIKSHEIVMRSKDELIEINREVIAAKNQEIQRAILVQNRV